MSAPMDETFDKQRVHLHAVTEFAARAGPRWIEGMGPELAKLPKGTVVAINCETGEYVIGKGISEASDAFEKRFGRATGWMHEIGGGFFVGGGIV
jgi:hypothetical protein